MINISKRDTIPNLLAAVAALTATADVDATFTADVQKIATDRLNAAAKLVSGKDQMNSANLNIRATAVGFFQQVEIQVAAFYDPTPPAATPATPAT